MDNAPAETTNALTGGYAPEAPTAAPVETAGQAEQQPVEAAPVEQKEQSDNWLSGFDEETQGYIGNKGWESVSDVLTSYQNLEKMRGVPAEQLYTIKPDMSPEDIEKVQIAMGRPSEIGEYKIQEVEGAIPGAVDLVKDFAFKNGLSVQAAEGMYSGINEFIVKTHQEHVEQINMANKQGFDSLAKEWGGAWDKNVNIAMRAAENLGITEQMQEAIKGSGQAPQFLQALTKIGSMMAEGDVVGVNPTQAKASMNALSPTEARAAIDRLRNDPNFKARMVSGDKKTRDAAQQELEPYYNILAQ